MLLAKLIVLEYRLLACIWYRNGRCDKNTANIDFRKKDVEVILLNPDNIILINEMADYLKIDGIEIQQRIENSLAKLHKIKNNLPDDLKIHFIIKVHDIPLNASAFLMDYDNSKEMRILVDYKIYNQEREKTYGIEFRSGSITQNLCDSYQKISRNATLY